MLSAYTQNCNFQVINTLYIFYGKAQISSQASVDGESSN